MRGGVWCFVPRRCCVTLRSGSEPRAAAISCAPLSGSGWPVAAAPTSAFKVSRPPPLFTTTPYSSEAKLLSCQSKSCVLVSAMGPADSSTVTGQRSGERQSSLQAYEPVGPQTSHAKATCANAPFMVAPAPGLTCALIT